MLLGAYGNSTINIGLRVNLIDNFSGPARQVKSAFGTLQQELKMYQENLRIARNMYTSLAMGGMVATSGMASMFKQGAAFDTIVRGAAAVATGGIESFGQMKKKANEIGQTSLFTPTDAAESMRRLGLAGFSANEVLKATAPIVSMAGASMTDLATSANIAISTMYQFGYAAKDMGLITDLLTVASNKSNIDITDLGESLKYVSASATQLGQSLPDVLAMLMVMGNQGLKGSLGGVGLENMFRYMTQGLGEYRKTKKSQIWLERFGLDPDSMVDAAGNMKPVLQIFEAMSKAALGGNVNAQNSLQTLFGARGARPANKLLVDLKSGQSVWKEFRAMLEDASKNPGFAEKINQFYLAGPGGGLKKLTGAWDVFKNEFTDALAPTVIPLVQALTSFLKLINRIGQSGFGKWILATAASAIVLSTIFFGFKAALASIYMAQAALKGSFGGMVSSMRVGWAQLTGDAVRYNRLQMMAVTGGLAPMSNMAMAQAGMGGMYMGAAGTVFRKSPLGMAGMAGTRVAAGFSSKLPIGTGAGLGRAAFGLTAAGAVGGAAKLAGIGGKLLGFLGGPWGLALTIGLPMAISGLSMLMQKNTEAVKDNTETNQQSSEESRLVLSYLANMVGNEGGKIRKNYKSAEDLNQKDMADYLLANKREAYLQNPSRYAGGRFYDTQDGTSVNIYVDGKIEKKIKAVMNDEISANLNLYP